MKIKKTKFKDLKIISSSVHIDKRGFFREIFKKKFFSKKNFVFTCVSSSKKNVLRGLHFQKKFSQGKYLSVLKGEIFDVAVDLRKNSKNFGKYFSIILSDKNGISIFIPPGFAHGFLGLKKDNIISYHCTNYRSKKNEVGILWNDKDLKIKWPIKKPVISSKDKKNISFKDYFNINE
jgi:dTDP-4-dehydrorhamnose 3,5-epimerase